MNKFTGFAVATIIGLSALTPSLAAAQVQRSFSVIYGPGRTTQRAAVGPQGGTMYRQSNCAYGQGCMTTGVLTAPNGVQYNVARSSSLINGVVQHAANYTFAGGNTHQVYIRF